MEDPHGLQRFVEAQNPVWRQVRAELAAGDKSSHWMWFVFPQLRGLGHSPMARRFGIASAAEARAYWRHPVLGARLKEACDLVLAHEDRSAHEIFGSPDELKFRSSMTLFAHAVPDVPVFRDAVHRYFDGRFDERTLGMLREMEQR